MNFCEKSNQQYTWLKNMFIIIIIAQAAPYWQHPSSFSRSSSSSSSWFPIDTDNVNHTVWVCIVYMISWDEIQKKSSGGCRDHYYPMAKKESRSCCYVFRSVEYGSSKGEILQDEQSESHKLQTTRETVTLLYKTCMGMFCDMECDLSSRVARWK